MGINSNATTERQNNGYRVIDENTQQLSQDILFNQNVKKRKRRQ